jgi:hypothetical protein
MTEQNLVKKSLSDPVRMSTALHAAAYMRWVETRKGVSPSQSDMQRYIRGWLDADGYAHEPDDLKMIDILALSLNIDMVHTFITESGIFEQLDRASAAMSGPGAGTTA